MISLPSLGAVLGWANKNRFGLLWTLVYIAVGAVLFWPTLVWMAERFNAYDSFYSHGWLIPVASLWLLWQRRGVIQTTNVAPDYRGLLLLIPSLLIHLLATRLQIGFAGGFALVFTCWGLVWTLFGWRLTWRLRFPLGFLLFMVPLPGILLIAASFQMKMMAASLATELLGLMGIAAEQFGSTIYVAGVTVIVDDTCSGLRSLISLIALAVLWISVLPEHAKTWQKSALVAASIPIALLSNMVRIMVLVLVAAIYGVDAAEGFIHDGSGYVVFGVAIILLAWLSSVLVPAKED